MRQSLAAVFLISALSFGPAWGQADRQQVPANLLIPKPPPSAPLADWVTGSGRRKLSQTVGDATLRGWEYAASSTSGKDSPTILFFNGNGMTIDRADSLYREIAALGANVEVYDYRGIGFSAGTPDVMTFRQDSLRLYDAVVAAHPGGPVIVYGFSLGTVMATYVASQRKLAGLILAGTIASATEEFPVYLRAVGAPPDVIATLAPAPEGITAFDEVGNIRQSAAPLLMLHGEADTLVPIAQGREVFAACAAGQKRFVALAGVTHNQTAGAGLAMKAVGEFLGSLMAR